MSRCSTSTGSCYQLTRRSPPDGNVTQVRQGCSENCVPEERNRVTRTCCNSSLCNAFPWQHSEIPAPLETNTVGTMIINPSYTRTIELNTNSEAVPFSSSSSSRTSATCKCCCLQSYYIIIITIIMYNIMYIIHVIQPIYKELVQCIKYTHTRVVGCLSVRI